MCPHKNNILKCTVHVFEKNLPPSIIIIHDDHILGGVKSWHHLFNIEDIRELHIWTSSYILIYDLSIKGWIGVCPCDKLLSCPLSRGTCTSSFLTETGQRLPYEPQGLLISINIGVIGTLWSNNPASVMQGNGMGFQSKNLELHCYHISSMSTTSQCSINDT